MAELIRLGEKGKIGVNVKPKEEAMEEYDLKTEALSTGGFWIILFVMYLPVIGWVATLIFSFGKNKNSNIRNLARATLINKLILLVMFSLLAWGLHIVYEHIRTQLNYLSKLISSLPDNPQNLVTILEKIKEISKYFQ
ncbi:hypothetical protein [Petroclostridium sp. X23]|uniref:hypothetical protein n=1 Tax=Petroclostridium sp. X23 TaxID=3045146 RepID=UPI0024ACE314|nr:hypothetical protein [Petroclostridium sp. X23]WHH61335.1 hypothetical protein QKW49_11800 [Petroclostridium sp. X23]